MAKENVRKFYKELESNKELQEKLVKAQESYTGDKNDRQSVVEAVFLPLAKEAGYDFTVEELKAAEREMVAEKGISEEELENVSGGVGFCLLIGFSDEISIGSSGDWEGGICAYLGLGFGVMA